MIIKNYKSLAVNNIRKKALKIIDAGFEAIKTENVLRDNIILQNENLKIGNKVFNLNGFEKIFVIGFGKVAFKAAFFLEKILGKKISGGAVIDIENGKLKFIKSFKGTHPYPSAKNIKATREISLILKNAGKKDLIIVIVSGGGSVLLCDPGNIPVSFLKSVIQELFIKGADIKEINIIRKHLSEIHGGNFAKLAYPATVVSLIFSDIPFKDLGLVASGPTFLDKTTRKDAEKISEKHILGSPVLTRAFKETPKNVKYFKKVFNILMVDNLTALKAMKKEAEKLGLKADIINSCLRGEAKEIGPFIVKKFDQRLSQRFYRKNSVIFFGGETTVKIKKPGKGGRNQELVLSALPFLKSNQLIASIASDGKDNIKEAAGALADYQTLIKAGRQNLNPEIFLKNNNSYAFFKAVGDVIITGNTGSNVSDLIIMINGESQV